LVFVVFLGFVFSAFTGFYVRSANKTKEEIMFAGTGKSLVAGLLVAAVFLAVAVSMSGDIPFLPEWAVVPH